MDYNQYEKICCICLDEYNINTTKCFRCVNRFHLDCVLKWKPICPICPICHAQITTYKIRLKQINKFILKNIRLIMISSFIISTLTYLIYKYLENFGFGIFLLFYHFMILFIGIIMEFIVGIYNIDFEYLI
jgi:hypothetical protein